MYNDDSIPTHAGLRRDLAEVLAFNFNRTAIEAGVGVIVAGGVLMFWQPLVIAFVEGMGMGINPDPRKAAVTGWIACVFSLVFAGARAFSLVRHQMLRRRVLTQLAVLPTDEADAIVGSRGSSALGVAGSGQFRPVRAAALIPPGSPRGA